MRWTMRPPVDRQRIQALATALSRATTEPTTLYLTGGATAVLEGWRESTVDVDIRLEPDTDSVMRAISDAKNALDINIELASPPDFVPELDGWRDRSPFVLQAGSVTVRHFDPYSQAFAKIKRGLVQDLADVQAMIATGLVEPARARELFAAAMPRLFRYPTIDPAALQRAIDVALDPHI